MSSSIAIPPSSLRKSARQSAARKVSASPSSSSTPGTPAVAPASAVPAQHNIVMPTYAANTSLDSASRTFPDATPSSSASSSSPFASPASLSTTCTLTAKDKGKGKMVITPEQIAEEERQRWAASPFRRRPSLMGKELEATKHIVVDVGAPDAPRLISCVASSQGFDWNSSIFLPRYLTGRYADEQMEHRQDPIEDIFVTDEEARDLFPQWA